MSYYSKLSSRFWTGDTGRALRGDAQAQVIATYLITSPHANMLGFYYLPLAYIASDTGIPSEGASKALRRLIDGGFCRYDEAAEVVWVVEMARIQIGESLEPKDKRVVSIRREYESLPNNRFLQDFCDFYGKSFHLGRARPLKGACEGASQAPSKPATATAAVATPATEAAATTTSAAASIPAASRRAENGQGRTVETWTAYAIAYRARWGVEPTRNKQVNAKLAQFVERVPIEEAPAIAAFYVESKRGLYTSAKHPVNLLLRDAEALRTEWLTGRHGTDGEARQADRAASSSEDAHRAVREKAARELFGHVPPEEEPHAAR